MGLGARLATYIATPLASSYDYVPPYSNLLLDWYYDLQSDEFVNGEGVSAPVSDSIIDFSDAASNMFDRSNTTIYNDNARGDSYDALNPTFWSIDEAAAVRQLDWFNDGYENIIFSKVTIDNETLDELLWIWTYSENLTEGEALIAEIAGNNVEKEYDVDGSLLIDIDDSPIYTLTFRYNG